MADLEEYAAHAKAQEKAAKEKAEAKEAKRIQEKAEKDAKEALKKVAIEKAKPQNTADLTTKHKTSFLPELYKKHNLATTGIIFKDNTKPYATLLEVGALDFSKLLADGKLKLFEHAVQMEVEGKAYGDPVIRSGQINPATGMLQGVGSLLCTGGSWKGMLWEGQFEEDSLQGYGQRIYSYGDHEIGQF